MMDDLLALDIVDDGAVAAGIRDRDRKVVSLFSPGTLSVTTVKGSFSKASPASCTVAKLSSTCCAPCRKRQSRCLPPYVGHEDSASHSTSATSPASFIPSVVET